MNHYLEQAKAQIKKNKDKLVLAGAGIATLGATYFYGKTKGNQTFNVDLFVVDTDNRVLRKESLTSAEE